MDTEITISNPLYTENVRLGQKTILYGVLIYIPSLLATISAVIYASIYFMQNSDAEAGMLNLDGFAYVGSILILAGIFQLVGFVIMLIGMFKMSKGLGFDLPLRIFCCVLLFITFVNVIALLILNNLATKHLRARGFKVGLMGAQISGA